MSCAIVKPLLLQHSSDPDLYCLESCKYCGFGTAPLAGLLVRTSLPSPLSSSPLTFSSFAFLVLHIFNDPPVLCRQLSACIFQPLFTQMNNRSRLPSGLSFHFLIHLHDSIYLLCHRETFLCIYCIISQGLVVTERPWLQKCDKGKC